MNVYQWICFIGLPSLSAIFLFFWKQIQGIRLGVKALLRAQMVDLYNKWYERGYAPIYAKDNFENLWVQYHAIKGPNGVMDDIHDKFMALPTEPEKKE